MEGFFYGAEHGITSEQQLAALDEMRGYETASDCNALTWQDIEKIIDIYQHTAKLTSDGFTRKPEDVFKEVLERFNNK